MHEARKTAEYHEAYLEGWHQPPFAEVVRERVGTRCNHDVPVVVDQAVSEQGDEEHPSPLVEYFVLQLTIAVIQSVGDLPVISGVHWLRKLYQLC